jgi:hypothetical protein
MVGVIMNQTSLASLEQAAQEGVLRSSAVLDGQSVSALDLLQGRSELMRRIGMEFIQVDSDAASATQLGCLADFMDFQKNQVVFGVDGYERTTFDKEGYGRA